MTDKSTHGSSHIRRRAVLKTVATTGTGIALAGCSQTNGNDSSGNGGDGTLSTGSGGSSGGTKTLKIGQPIPLTGPGTVYGLPTQGGTQIAVDEINSDGGIDAGDATYTIEYVTADSQCGAEAGRNAAQKLISSEGVDLLFGGNCPTANLAWIDMLTKEEMFLVIEGNESVKLHSMGSDHDYIFSPFTVIYNDSFPNLSRMYPFGTYAVKELGFENVAFLTPKIQYGLSTQKYIAQAVKEAGGSVAGNVTHPFGASDFSNQIAKLKSLNADAIISSTFPNAFFAFLQQATDAGLRDQSQIVSAQSPAEDVAHRLVNDDVADGFLDFALTYQPAQQAAAAGDIQSGPAERAKQFRSKFQDRFPKRTFNTLAMSGYEAMHLLKAAVENAGGVDNGSLTEGFDALTWADVEDTTLEYYVPPNGSVKENQREGNIFGGGNQAFYENSLQRWNNGKKEYQELIRVGSYWN